MNIEQLQQEIEQSAREKWLKSQKHKNNQGKNPTAKNKFVAKRKSRK